MDYLNFDLRLGDWNPLSNTGVAEVLQAPAGQGPRYAFLLDTESFAPGRRAARSTDYAAELGRQLTDRVLAQGLPLWYESLHIARERGRGLRLRLHIDAWELAQLPWELLYDPRKDDFFVFDPLVSIARYIRLQAVLPTLRQASALRLLVVSAAPRDQVPLDTPREIAILRDALQHVQRENQLEFYVLEHATHETLHGALLDHTPDVVHFIGHADYDAESRRGSLVLEDRHGMSYLLGAQDTARLLRRYGTNLVVLNACATAQGAWAGLSPALVRCEIPAVVSMQWPVEDSAAIAFSHTFYHSLAMGKTVDECMAEARVGVSTATSSPDDWAAPVLFLRSSSGQLWRTGGATSAGGARVPRPVGLRQPEGAASTPAEAERPYFFRTHGPLSAPRDEVLIVDRPELRRALRIAQQPSITDYIAVLGARQTGKTTLLLRLMHYLRDFYGCVFIDMSVLRAQDARACFRFVAFRLLDEFRAVFGSDLALPEMGNIESSVDFLEFLRELARLVPLTRIVILIDEVGSLSPSVSDVFYNTLRTVFNEGRSHSQELSKYLFVFSGAVDLYDLTSGVVSPLNICVRLNLQDLAVADVERIVNAFPHHLGLPVDEGVAERIYTLACGHPYLTMRLCALIEQEEPVKVTLEAVETAAEQMLIDDENIRYMLRKLEQHPQALRRVRSILEGRTLPFSSNDPILGALEMFGTIRHAPLCEIRNELYRRALEQYVGQRPETEAVAASEQADDTLAMFARLQALRTEALASDGTPTEGRAWANYAAALFATLPAFSIYPQGYADLSEADVVLSVQADAPETRYWHAYLPAVMATHRDVSTLTAEELLASLASGAERHNISLVFVLAGAAGGEVAGSAELVEASAALECYSGTSGDLTIVLLDDRELATILEEQQDLESFLRRRVLDARLRKWGSA